jgi:hypothetical protein
MSYLGRLRDCWEGANSLKAWRAADHRKPPPEGGMVSKRIIVPAAAVLAFCSLVACGGGSSSPTVTAASILSESGAKADGPAYVVDTSQGNGPACDNGSAEADGSFPGGETMNVCVFPNAAVLKNDAGTQLELWAMQGSPTEPAKAGDPVVQVGDLTLIYMTPRLNENIPRPSAQQVAKQVNGTVLVP